MITFPASSSESKSKFELETRTLTDSEPAAGRGSGLTVTVPGLSLSSVVSSRVRVPHRPGRLRRVRAARTESGPRPPADGPGPLVPAAWLHCSLSHRAGGRRSAQWQYPPGPPGRPGWRRIARTRMLVRLRLRLGPVIIFVSSDIMIKLLSTRQ